MQGTGYTGDGNSWGVGGRDAARPGLGWRDKVGWVQLAEAGHTVGLPRESQGHRAGVVCFREATWAEWEGQNTLAFLSSYPPICCQCFL